jgi:hypothetical protein
MPHMVVLQIASRTLPFTHACRQTLQSQLNYGQNLAGFAQRLKVGLWHRTAACPLRHQNAMLSELSAPKTSTPHTKQNASGRHCPCWVHAAPSIDDVS